MANGRAPQSASPARRRGRSRRPARRLRRARAARARPLRRPARARCAPPARASRRAPASAASAAEWVQPEPCAAPSGWRWPSIATRLGRPRRRRAGRSRASRWPPVSTTARGPQRQHRAREALGLGLVGARAAAPRPQQRARLGYVRREHARARQDLLDERVLRVGREQPRAGLRDHHRVDHDGRAAPSSSSAAATASVVSRSPSIPTLTASTPMSAEHGATWARSDLRRHLVDALDAERVLRGDRRDRARAVHAAARRTPSGRPGCPRRRPSPSRRSSARRVRRGRPSPLDG